MKRNPVLWITVLFFALGLTFGCFQMLPGESLTEKTALFLIVVFLISISAGRFLFGGVHKYFSLSLRVRWTLLAAGAIVAILLVSFFHLSFPQKELALPVRSIQITVQAETDNPVTFLSLNNGYRGISLTEFLSEGDWQRNGDAFVLGNPSEKNSLRYAGKAGQNAALFFRSSVAGCQLQIDWGDGKVESVPLITTLDEAGPQMIRHDYGESAAAAEKWNFFINLLSVWMLLAVALALYFHVLTGLMTRRSRKFAAIFLLLTASTVVIRTVNVYNFPLGWDEGTYSRAAMRYSEKMLAFQWADIPAITYNHEHPAFVKLMYAIPATLDGRAYFERFGWAQGNRGELGKEDYTIFTSRLVSAVFSLWTVQALTLLVHPLAGFFFMIHSFGEEFGAQARLEAIPTLFSFLSVWIFWSALAAFRRKEELPLRKIVFSAVLLGLTAASKIMYCVIAFAITAIAIETLITYHERRKELIRTMIIMSFLSLLSFFIFNPSLWYAPMSRVTMMFGFHEQYQSNAREIYPWWQPVVWMTRSIAHHSSHFAPKSPLGKSPEKFFFSADELIVLLACLGVPQLFRKKRIYLYWFVIGTIFLFLWGTKWVHYACIVTVPICIAACYGMLNVSEWLLRRKTEEKRVKIDVSQHD